MLFGFFHFCTATLHLMVCDALSGIVPIVAVNQLPINIVVVDKGSSIMFLVTSARYSQSATARLFLLFLYCIDSMFMLFVRGIAKNISMGFFQCSREYTSENFSGGKPPDPIFFFCTYLFT